MQQYIRSVTQNLLSRITDQQLYYTPSDLLTAGYPDFVVQRIELELQRNLAESITLPDSDWADMQADPVQDAWDRFLEAIHAETRIPDSFLQSVTENAVEDILELLAEPERYILDTLFRNQDDVSILELHARRPWIVLNGHLADAVIRYMQRRNLQSMKRFKAANIIRQIDQHLASGYTPLKWAQALDVCYTLMGQLVPSALVSRYFADKGLTHIAKRMENADEELSRSRLIEYLSLPDLNWDEDEFDHKITGTAADGWAGVKDEKPALQPSHDPEANQKMSFPSELGSISDTQAGSGDDQSTSDDDRPDFNDNFETSVFSSYAEDDAEDVPSIFELASPEEEQEDDFFAALAETPSTQAEHSTEPESLTESESLTEPEPSTEPESSTEPKSLTEEDDPFDFGEPETDQEEAAFPFLESDNDDADLAEYSPEITDEEPDAEPVASPSYSDAVPIWQRFLNAGDEDLEAQEPDKKTPYRPAVPLAGEEDGDQTEEASIISSYSQFTPADEEDTMNDNPFAPEEDQPTAQEGPLTPEASHLLAGMDAHADILLEVLFKNDLDVFYDTLNTLSGYKTWQDAGKYLTREVFIPLEIDLYSGEAVLFVDLLQQYFEEKNA